jgi:hypothetical protein
MKRFLLILIAAIFCLPNVGFAQGLSLPSSSETIDPSQGAMASIWFQGTYVGPIDFDWENKPQKPSKPRVKVSYLRAAEVSTDEATGLTTLRWNDGSSYVGETYRTVFHGMGTMIYPDKGKYYGQWKYSYRDGIGTMEYADGSKYVGKWVRDLPNGEGTFINPEGIAFSGTFKNGVPHGKCVMQDLDGRKYTARWVRGILKEKSIKPLEEK